MLFVAFFFVPAFFYFRHKMTHQPDKDHPVKFYTKSRVWHITLLIFSFMIVVTIMCFILFFSIKYRNYHFAMEFPELLLLGLFFSVWLLVAFGSGMYLSGILVEQYTMKELRTDPEFKKLKTAIKLFHGPISHVFIYSGGLGLLLVISFLEFFNPAKFLEPIVIFQYIAVGIVFGTIYFISQIRNKTWKHQLPGFFIILVIDLIFIGANIDRIQRLPFSIFVLTMLITCNTGLLIWRFFYKPINYVYN